MVEFNNIFNPGFLYIISNPLWNTLNIFKIGSTSNINKRLHNYSTPLPEPCVLEHLSNPLQDKLFFEFFISNIFEKYRYRENREFYSISIKDFIYHLQHIYHINNKYNTPLLLLNYIKKYHINYFNTRFHNLHFKPTIRNIFTDLEFNFINNYIINNHILKIKSIDLYSIYHNFCTLNNHTPKSHKLFSLNVLRFNGILKKRFNNSFFFIINHNKLSNNIIQQKLLNDNILNNIQHNLLNDNIPQQIPTATNLQHNLQNDNTLKEIQTPIDVLFIEDFVNNNNNSDIIDISSNDFYISYSNYCNSNGYNKFKQSNKMFSLGIANIKGIIKKRKNTGVLFTLHKNDIIQHLIHTGLIRPYDL